MNQHTDDPTGHSWQNSESPTDSWEQASRHWANVRHRVRAEYGTEDTPASEQIKDALNTIGSAVIAAFRTMGRAAQDSVVRNELKEAGIGLANAVGETVTGWAKSIRTGPREPGDNPPTEEP